MLSILSGLAHPGKYSVVSGIANAEIADKNVKVGKAS